MCARADQANDGLSRKEAIDNIQELNQSISREAASRQLSCRVLPANAKAGITKSQCQKVQATTSERTTINVAQQFRWHSLVDYIYNAMREKNTGRGLWKTCSYDVEVKLDVIYLMSNMTSPLYWSMYPDIYTSIH